jgi:tetratricopeptide (TPR) repeat protein
MAKEGTDQVTVPRPVIFGAGIEVLSGPAPGVSASPAAGGAKGAAPLPTAGSLQRVAAQAGPAAAAASPGAAAPAQASSRARFLTIAVLANSALAIFMVGLLLAVSRPIKIAPDPRNYGFVSPSTMPGSNGQASISPEGGVAKSSSWGSAQRLFAGGSYGAAFLEFRDLAAAWRENSAQGPAGDLLALRQAQCLQRLGRFAEAREGLTVPLGSTSAAVQAGALHLLAVLDTRASSWMHARKNAYQAVAAMGWLERPCALETDCDFLASEMLVREVMPLYNKSDEAGPADTIIAAGSSLAWRQMPDLGSKAADPFAGLDDSALAAFLEEGASSRPAPLGVLVRKSEEGDGHRYDVTCVKAPLEEVLARFAAESGLEVKWEGVGENVRRLPVTLRMKAQTPQRLLEIACGSAALVARFTGQEAVVFDPASAASAARRREVLTAEAASAWRRLFLRVPQDPRLPEAHYLLGAVYECSGDSTAALTEYRMLANRFPASGAAASGLIRSAGLRMEMNDYAGASKDLVEVLDSQADPALAEQAHLRLGVAAMRAGLFDDAERAFRKLYYLDVSLSAKAGAAMYLGRCLHAKGEFAEAAKWLTAYLGHSRATTGEGAREAGFLLAQCRVATSQPAEAAAAFRMALAADKDPRQTARITLEFCRFLMAQEDSIGALGALDALEGVELPEPQAGETLVLRAQVLRAIGLPRAAIRTLRLAGSPAVGSPLERQVSVELARCRAADGDLEAARAALTEILPRLPKSAQTQTLVCELAEICLRLGEARQTISLTADLLKAAPPAEVRRRAAEALAAACVMERDFDGAALAYAAMSEAGPAPADKDGAEERAPAPEGQP